MKKYVFIAVIAIVLSAIGYGAYTYYQISNPKGLFEDVSPPKREETVDKREEDKTEEPVSAEVDPLLQDPFQFSDRVNLLFLGLDASVERYETMGSFRTDTIMLVSIDFDSNRVDIISIPRDSYVKIPGREKREKINAAFVRGGGFKGKGFEKTIETVSHFLGGIPIHYYIGVDMNVVKDVVDIMGGIDYDVDVRVQIGDRVIEKGFQHLNGQQVLDYARNRKSGRGDIDRVDRQQKIVIAIFNQLKSTKQLLKIPQFYTTVMERVHTNLDIKQIAGLAYFAVNIDMEDIHRHMIPGGFLNMDKISYWGIDEMKKKELIKEIFGVDIQIDPKNDIKYIKKELEEKEKAFKEAVAKSQQIIDECNEMVASYQDIIKKDEMDKVSYHITQIDHAVEDGDIDSVKKATSEFKEYVSKLKSALEERHNAISKAQAVLEDIASKTKKYQEFIRSGEKDALNKKIGEVNQAVKSKDVQSINKAVGDLESYGAEVFKACQQRKEAKEQEDKKAAERAQAVKNAQTIVNETKNGMENYKEYLTEEERNKLNEKIANVNNAINNKEADAQTINKAAQDLKTYRDEVFSQCQKRKDEDTVDPPEDENPEPEQPADP